MKTLYMSGEVLSDDYGALYEQEGLPCIYPSKVKEWLDSVPLEEDICLEINSPGGSVTSALSIVDLISHCKSMNRTITARVIGLAASAATLISCICDKVEISNTAFFMIHNSMSFAFGNSKEIMKTVRVLDKIDNLAVNLYMKHANKGVTKEKFLKLMEEETWLIDNDVKEIFNFTVLTDKDNEDLDVTASVSKDVLMNYKNTPEELFTSTLKMKTEEETKETSVSEEETMSAAKEILKYIDSLKVILE